LCLGNLWGGHFLWAEQMCLPGTPGATGAPWGISPRSTANLSFCYSTPALHRQKRGTRDATGTLLKHPNHSDHVTAQ